MDKLIVQMNIHAQHQDINMEDKLISISGPKVMESPAGYYIGKDCLVEYNFEDGEVMTITEPYTRITTYYRSAVEAKKSWYDSYPGEALAS